MKKKKTTWRNECVHYQTLMLFHVILSLCSSAKKKYMLGQYLWSKLWRLKDTEQKITFKLQKQGKKQKRLMLWAMDVLEELVGTFDT